MYGARTVTPLMLGSSGFSVWRFLVLDAVTVLGWSLVVAYAGYTIGAFLTVFLW